MKKVLIVGGVAGGASTATRLRRLDENLEIVIFEKGEYVSFANCGLPYYIGDIIQNRESLLVQTPESLKARFNLDVRVNSEVVGVNGKDKKVKVKTKNGEEYEEIFDFSFYFIHIIYISKCKYFLIFYSFYSWKNRFCTWR